MVVCGLADRINTLHTCKQTQELVVGAKGDQT